MTLQRGAAAARSVPTINLASIVHGLDAYMRSRGADAGEPLRRAGLAREDLIDPDRRVPLIREALEVGRAMLAQDEMGLAR